MTLTTKQADFLRGLTIIEHPHISASEAGCREIQAILNDGLWQMMVERTTGVHWAQITLEGKEALSKHRAEIPVTIPRVAVPERGTTQHVLVLDLDICDPSQGDDLAKIELHIAYNYKPPVPPKHSNDTGVGPEIQDRKMTLMLGNARVAAPSGIIQYYEGAQWDDVLIRHAEKERL